VPSTAEPADNAFTFREVPVAFEKPRLVAKKFVVVALVPVALVKVTPAREETPVTESVPVAVRLEVVRPPKSVRVVVAKAPRFVTEARVSASAAAEGQPTPFCKQIPCPATVAEAKEAKFALKIDPVALTKVSKPLTLTDELKTKSPVEVPPPNWIAFVVVLPAFVTVWKFGLVLEGQLVPFAKQTAIPFTSTAVDVTIEAERTPAFNVAPVAFPNTSKPAATVFAFNIEPVAFVNPKFEAKIFVAVAFVPVASVNVTPPNEDTPPTVSVPVAVTFDVVKPPNNVTLEVAKAPRFVTEASVSASAAVEGQPTPFCKQIPCPATVAEANEAKFALSVEPVALPKDKIPIAALFEFNEVPVAETNESNPVEARFVAVVF
jgi:hypothetical protein